MPLGQRVRDARKRLGLNQADFAKAIGVSRDTVWRLERDENVRKDNVLAALKRLGLDEPGLTGDVEPSPRRQALARALLRAYDSSEAMAATLETIARPHLDDEEAPPRDTAPPADAPASGPGKRARTTTGRGRR